MALGEFRGGGRVQKNKVSSGGNVRLQFEYDLAPLAEQAREFLEEVARVGEQAAKRRVPRRTGKLASTIKGGVQRRGAKISAVISAGGADAPYWAFVEYGTGLRGQEFSGDASSTGSRETPPGWRYDHRGRKWRGQAPQPYLRPAIDDMRAFLRGG